MRVLYRIMRHPLWVTKDRDYAEHSLMEWGDMNDGHEWYLSALGAINGFLPLLIDKKLAFNQDDDGNLTLITLPGRWTGE
jgi:hypothetical protein